MEALVVIALIVVFDVLVFFWGYDSRDGLRSDQCQRFADWIESAAQRRAGVMNTIVAPAQHVGQLFRDGRRREIEPVVGSKPVIGRHAQGASTATGGPDWAPVSG